MGSAYENCKGIDDEMAETVAQEMERRLRDAFAPTRLEIINDSAKHRGHMGDDGSCCPVACPSYGGVHMQYS